jgi:hypothetical protein
MEVVTTTTGVSFKSGWPRIHSRDFQSLDARDLEIQQDECGSLVGPVRHV